MEIFMRKGNLDKIKKMNEEIAVKGFNAVRGNCSWVRNIHQPAVKSPYKTQDVENAFFVV